MPCRSSTARSASRSAARSRSASRSACRSAAGSASRPAPPAASPCELSPLPLALPPPLPLALPLRRSRRSAGRGAPAQGEARGESWSLARYGLPGGLGFGFGPGFGLELGCGAVSEFGWRGAGRTEGERGAARDQEHAHRRDGAARNGAVCEPLQQAAGQVARGLLSGAVHAAIPLQQAAAQQELGVARGGGAEQQGLREGGVVRLRVLSVGIVRVEEAAALRRGPPAWRRVGAISWAAEMWAAEMSRFVRCATSLHATRERGRATPARGRQRLSQAPRDPTRRATRRSAAPAAGRSPSASGEPSARRPSIVARR